MFIVLLDSGSSLPKEVKKWTEHWAPGWHGEREGYAFSLPYWHPQGPSQILNG